MNYSKGTRLQEDEHYDYRYNYARESFRKGIRLIVGLNYVHKEKIIFGAELLPSFSNYSGSEINERYGIEENESISGVSYGLSNSSARLSIAYRF